MDQAVLVLAAALLLFEEDDEPSHAAPASKRRRRATLLAAASTALAEEGSVLQAGGTDDLAERASETSADVLQSRASADSVPEESAGATDVNIETNPLWNYVAPCTTREATKSAEVRAALEEMCGKDVARSLLTNTKATVAQDPSGKKNRVLKLGGSLIKLK